MRRFLDVGTGCRPHRTCKMSSLTSLPMRGSCTWITALQVGLFKQNSQPLPATRQSGAAAGATEYIDADLRDTGRILTQAAELLDFSQPVAVTLLAILHAIPDPDDPYAIVAKIMDAVPSGSYLAISHAGSDLLDQQTLDSIHDIVTQMVHLQPGFRSREQVGRFFDGLGLVEPGLVRPEEWRPGLAAADADPPRPGPPAGRQTGGAITVSTGPLPPPGQAAQKAPARNPAFRLRHR